MAVVFDIATPDPDYRSKIFRVAPNVKAFCQEGKLAGGQLLID